MPKVTLHSRVVHQDYEFSIHKPDHEVDRVPVLGDMVAAVIDRHGHVKQFTVETVYQERGTTHVACGHITPDLPDFSLPYVTGLDCFPGAGWQITAVQWRGR